MLTSGLADKKGIIPTVLCNKLSIGYDNDDMRALACKVLRVKYVTFSQNDRTGFNQSCHSVLSCLQGSLC